MENWLDLLFTETPSGLPEINKEAKLLKSVRAIIESDPGKMIKGEKVKDIARKELAYVYFYNKPNAFDGYRDEERKLRIKERVGLPDKWIPSQLVLDAIIELKEDSVSKLEKLLNLARTNLDDYVSIHEEIRAYFRKLLPVLSNTKDVLDLTADELKERKEAIEQGQAFAKSATTSISDIQKAFLLIDSLEDSIKQTKKKEGKKRLSSSETDKGLYKMEGEDY